MLGSYYPPYYPTPGQVRVAPGVGGLGATTSPSIGVSLLLGMAINAGCGYLVGKHTGMPVETAIASGIFGLPGMFGAVWYANRQRRGA